MLLIYIQKPTPRISYTFRQIFTEILGMEFKFTSKIEDFIAHDGMKFSYGKESRGNELFVKSASLLWDQGIENQKIKVESWGDSPCFFKTSETSDLPFDIFAASFYLLSRYEEYLPHNNDRFNRYPAAESLAFKNDFLKKPVVDIWAFKFKRELQKRFSGEGKPVRKVINKNVLAVGEVYKYKKKGSIRTVGASLRDFFQFNITGLIERIRVLLFLKKDPYDVYEQLISFAKREKISWLFMFQLSNYSIYSKNISYNKTNYHALIKSMGDYGDLGLLAGLEAIQNFDTLKTEKKRWESIVNRPLKMILNNKYDLHLPEVYNNFDKLEIERDFSMGFVDEIGFRAGTGTPFLFYDIQLERILPLVMETPVFNSRLMKEHSYFKVKTNLEEVREEIEAIGGTITLIFQNSDFYYFGEKCNQILTKMNHSNE